MTFMGAIIFQLKLKKLNQQMKTIIPDGIWINLPYESSIGSQQKKI